MIGPKKKPTLQSGDHHLIVNDIAETMKAYDHTGTLLWEVPCLARGQYGEIEWKAPRSDTPPGLYKIGQVWDDYCRLGDACPYDHTHLAYGFATFDLVDMEGNEDNNGRAGICIHGGGSGCGLPGAWAPKQHLLPTYGCIRCYNIDLIDKILPLTKKGTVWVSVFQES